MKNLVIAALFSLSLETIAFGAEDRPLSSGGRVIHKVDETKLGKNCSARREYAQLVGLPSPGAQERINKNIRREMTVGRKLKPSDCPGPGDSENLEYANSATMTGERKGKLGVYSAVRFPGGSGRYNIRCAAYNLKTGQRKDLANCVNKSSEAQGRLTELFCEKKRNPGNEEPKQSSEEDTGCRGRGSEGEIYCLDDNGVQVKSYAYGMKMFVRKILVTGEDWTAPRRLDS